MKYSIIFLALALKILVTFVLPINEPQCANTLFRGLEYTSMSDPAITINRSRSCLTDLPATSRFNTPCLPVAAHRGGFGPPHVSPCIHDGH